MEQYREILKELEAKLAARLDTNHGLICKQLQFDDETASLYIAKPHWTNRFDPQRDSTVGIFCAVWVSLELLEKNQFAYNMHSIKLRQLPGYKLASRQFASDFRKAVEASVADWPNVRMDYGPLTLLEGRCDCSIDRFAEDVEARVHGFVSIHQEVEKLLEASRH